MATLNRNRVGYVLTGLIVLGLILRGMWSLVADHFNQVSVKNREAELAANVFVNEWNKTHKCNRACTVFDGGAVCRCKN